MRARFLCGAPELSWAEDHGDIGPLFISFNRICRLKFRPIDVTTDFAIDSGGFTQLSNGGWPDGCEEPYIAAIRRLKRFIWRGGHHLLWIAPQDWMCEEEQLANTGLTVLEHQRRTVRNFARLTQLAPDLPWAMAVQGDTPRAYLRILDMYADAGVDPLAQKIVGVGSICRIQHTDKAVEIIETLHDAGLRKLHGFGLKTEGLAKVGHLLTSADSMAWSEHARKQKIHLDGCSHKRCVSCPKFAKQWRDNLINRGLAA
ncbi:hypothetical protein ACIBCT_35350 [Streptosporangium sp. NPDC050855]|uniref:deazapurine DNA modification protein DpdA family protein n=1 Tax=Streptosporangium sp. NPDC050855 TaxID=3366194 RepID=UPI0037A899CC